MKIKRLLILMFLLFSIKAFAQYYTPQSPLSVSKSNLNKTSIVQTLSSQRVLFSPIDIDELKLAIRKSNNKVDNEISVIRSNMSNLFMDKQELLQLKDIKKINEVIAEKKKNRKEIEDQIKSDLSNINYKGLFIVVMKEIDPWASKQKLADQSEGALAPRAIEDLNGVFISSMTQVENFMLVSDMIKSIISGEMSIEKQYISRTIDNRTKFLYLVKVNVAPLKKSLKTARTAAEASEKNLILNAMTEQDYSAKLQQFGVSDSEVNKIDFEVQSSRESICLTNSTASRREMDIIRNGNANITKIDEDIKTLKNSLTNRSGILKKIIEEKTNVKYDPGKPDKSINSALAYLDGELNNLKNQLISVKEKELIARYSVSVTTEGTPAEDIAKTAVDISGQIEQSYSKIEQFMEETSVENYRVTDFKQAQQKDVYRKLETVWLYPVAGDQDNFLLTIVAKFRITDKTVKSKPVTKKPVSTEPAREINYDEMVHVQGGEFIMGTDDEWHDSDEQPAHKVKVNSFYIGKYEVTNAQFYRFLNEMRGKIQNEKISTASHQLEFVNGKLRPKKGLSNHPMIFVNWYGAKAYAEWAGGRLPTEAEWEYAAQGGLFSKGFKYSGSNNAEEVGWTVLNSSERTNPVGLKKSNELGLYDMTGNVNEWCFDWYGRYYYKKSPYNNPKGPSDGTERVCRTGGHHYFSVIGHTDIDNIHNRTQLKPEKNWSHVGFRIVKDSRETHSDKTSPPNTMTDIDGNVYKTVKIGNQVWMAENLKVTRYRNGKAIPKITDDSKWGYLVADGYCVYDNNEHYAEIYGYLYNWDAVNNSNNIAPPGWHVPSDEEWKELEMHLGMSSSEVEKEAVRGHNEGCELKESSNQYWRGSNSCATNSTGFTALPGGQRYADKNSPSLDIGTHAIFWSSTKKNIDKVWTRSLRNDYIQILRHFSNTRSSSGFSVRLIKDSIHSKRTESQNSPGIMRDVDGNVYKTVQIGDQVWMAENLKVTRYRNGDAIPKVTEGSKWINLKTGAYCVHHNDEKNAETYGYLYNWYVVSDSRNIASEGWHVPTDKDFQILINHLGGTNAGGKLKEKGTVFWLPPNKGASNISGFSARPGGSRYVGTGSFWMDRKSTHFWTSTRYDNKHARDMSLGYDYSEAYINRNYKINGFSVRLIKDNSASRSFVR